MDYGKKIVADTTPSVFSSNMKSALLILFLAIAIYLPTLWFGFSPMDEKWAILDYKKEYSEISNMPKVFSNPVMEMYYRPIWTSSLMFDLISGKGSPFTFHLTNILLHAFCCLLLFKVFIVLGVEKKTSLWCAIIFALHPINIHTVAWIPGRNDSLLCLFSLLSVFYLIKFLETDDIISLSAHCISFCLALLSKENAIVLPVLFGIISLFVVEQKNNRKLVTLFIPWLLIGLCWFLLRKSIIDFFLSSGGTHFSETLLNFLSAIVIYIGKCVIPIQQSIMPMVQNTSLIPGIFVIALIAFLSIKFGFKEKRIAILGMLWFFIFIVIPVWVGATNTNGEHYEHRVYTSLIGFMLMVSQINIQLNKKTATILLVILAVVLSAKTIYRYQVYKNELSFATAATSESPTVAMLQNIEGLEYVKTKGFNKAINCFTKAIELNPNKGEYYNNRAGCYLNLKDFSHALQDYNKAIDLQPTNGTAYLNRSMTHFSLGHTTPAVNDLQQAAHLHTNGIPQEYIDAVNLAFQNEIIATYSAKIDQHPNEAVNYNIRGVAYYNLKNLPKALADYNKAIELEPGNTEFIYNRFLLYSYSKNEKNALQDQQLLIKLGFKSK
jgi:Flp pilus assembly protein TadD